MTVAGTNTSDRGERCYPGRAMLAETSSTGPRGAGARAYDLVIFDCDGVLVDSERLVNRIESRHLASLGISMTPEEISRAFRGRTLPEIATLIEARPEAKLSRCWLYDYA